MKMYKKSDLTIIDGMLVNGDGDIVMPDVRVIEQANELETLVQKAEYLSGQPEATPMPSLEGFERKSEKDADVHFHAKTPELDKKAEEAMAIMDELDDMATVDAANDMVDKFPELLAFVSNDYVVDFGCGGVLVTFDTPTLGSVLKLTKDDVIDAIAYACGMDKGGITKHETVMAAIPATEYNLGKIKEFFDSLDEDAEDHVDPLDDVRDFVSAEE